MALVNIDELREGMFLADDVVAQNGRLLLPKGTRLAGKHIHICKAWGVTEAEVTESREASRRDDPSREDRQAGLELIKPYFVTASLKNPAVQELVKVSAGRLAQQRARGRDPRLLLPSLQPRSLDGLTESAEEEKRLARPERLLQEEIRLASLPDIYYRIMELMNSRHCSALQLADLVSKDSSLSARLLKLVNSPFYGFTTQVDTISRAIVLLGLNKLVTIMQGISVVRVFQSIPSEIVDMESFWRHALACGVYAKLLSSQKVGLDEERYFVAGLLHDIGRLILYKRLPGLSAQALQHSLERRQPLQQAEEEVFGFDHSAIGAWLCRKWNLPADLRDMIACHHQPGSGEAGADAAIVHLADILAVGLGQGTSGNLFVPPLDEAGWEVLDLRSSVIPAIVRQADRQLDEMLEIFIG